MEIQKKESKYNQNYYKNNKQKLQLKKRRKIAERNKTEFWDKVDKGKIKV